MEKETLETQMKSHLYFLSPYFSPFLFLSSLSLPLSPWIWNCARTGQAAAAGQAETGRRRPARPRPSDGGRSGRMLVSEFSPFLISQILSFEIPRS